MTLRRSTRVASKPDEPPTKKSKTQQQQEEQLDEELDVDVDEEEGQESEDPDVEEQDLKEEGDGEAEVEEDDDEEEVEEEVEEDGDENDDSIELQVGDELPNLELKNQDDKSIKILDAAKDYKYIVIFSYPKASTSGCTKQAIGFNDHLSFFKDHKTIVFGLSSDSPKDQKKFADKHGFEYDLLSDPSKELITLLGVKKEPSGIIRSHFIFEDGVLSKKEINVKPDDSYTKAKAEIENLEANGDDKKEVKEEKGASKEQEEDKKAKENNIEDAEGTKDYAAIADKEGEGNESSKLKEAEDREADLDFKPTEEDLANEDEPSEAEDKE